MALSTLVMLLVATLGIGTQPVSGQNPTFSAPVNLSNTPTGNSQFPQTAASGNYVYLVWQDDVLGKPNIYFRASSNNGTTFGGMTLLSSNLGWAEKAQIAVSGRNVYVVWQDNSTSNFKTYLRASSNYGASFASQLNLGTTPRVDETNQDVAASANNVYVVWVENSRIPTVLFSASSNYGSSFANPVTLSGSSGTSFSPLVAVSGSNVYVVWRQNVASGNDDVFFEASSTNGTSFASINNLSNNSGESFNPAIAANSNGIYVAWPDNTGLTPATNYDIFFKASTNNGASFSTVQNLSVNNGTSLEPQIAASGNNVFVAWQDNTPGTPNILFKRSGNNGANFGTTFNLSNDKGSSENPQIAATGSEVYLVWDDTNTAGAVPDIFFTSSGDGGIGFGSVLNLSNNPGFSTNSQVAAYGSDVYVVWQDDTPTPGFSQIFFTVGTPTITVLPVAYPTSLRLIENQSVIVVLTGSDPSGLPLTFSIVSGPTHGTLGTLASAGPTFAEVSYRPNLNFIGSDSFTFKVNNGNLDSAPATVSIAISPPAAGGGGGRRAFPM